MKIKLKATPKDIMPTAGLKKSNQYGMIASNTTSTEDNVNASIHPIDPEKANAELEKGEILLKFDLGGLFAVQGKKHSQGGTPVNANDGDFIFSDDPSLAISKEEQKQFRFKINKSNSKKENTPAKVLQREVNPKEYNQLINIINDKNSDKISKNTAILMLNKYLEKVGRVAYLQEEKKNSEIPEFAMGTAPMFAEDLADIDSIEQQYKQGGIHIDPKNKGKFTASAKQHRMGVQEFAKHVLANKEDFSSTQVKRANFAKNASNFKHGGGGPIIPYFGDKNDKKNASVYSSQDWNDFAKALGFKGKSNKEFQEFLINNPDYQDVIIKSHEEKGNTLPPPAGNSVSNWIDGRIGYRWDVALKTWKDRLTPLSEVNPIDANDYFTNSNTPDKTDSTAGTTPNTKTSTNNTVAPLKNTDFKNLPSTPFEGYDFDPNSAEMLSIATPFLSAFAQPTRYQMLAQKHTAPIRLDRVNDAQFQSDNASQASLAKREMFSNLDARTAALNSAMVDSSSMQRALQSNAQTNQTNIQIANQESMINDQKSVGDRDFNIAAIMKTFDDNTRASQYRSEQLTNGFNASLNNMLTVEKNLSKLSQDATTAAIPFLGLKGVTADGEVVEPTDPRAVRTIQTSPLKFNKNRKAVVTGLGSLNSLGVDAFGNKVDNASEFAKAILTFAKETGISDPYKAAQALAGFKQLMKQNGFNNQNQ